MLKILFTNAGRRTYLVDFALDLRRSGYPVDVHVSDCSPLSAAMHVAPEVGTHLLPPVLDNPDAYMESLIDLVRQQGFDLIFPLSDLDPHLIAGHRDRFLAMRCTPVGAGDEAVACCNDKRKTFQFCRQHALPTPMTWFDLDSFDGRLPVLQKHVFGSGSSGIRRIGRSEDLNGFVPGRDLLQEIIDGEEYGLDILNDLHGNAMAVCVKRKLLMRAGETDKARVIRDASLENLGIRIGNAFRHIGNLDCDILRAASGEMYCIDFNPRFGGGYPATHLAGFNYLRAILDMARGEPLALPAQPRPITVMKGISLHWCDTP